MNGSQSLSEPGIVFLYFVDEEIEATEVTQGCKEGNPGLPRSQASDLSGALFARPSESQRGPALLPVTGTRSALHSRPACPFTVL